MGYESESLLALVEGGCHIIRIGGNSGSILLNLNLSRHERFPLAERHIRDVQLDDIRLLHSGGINLEDNDIP